MLSKICRPRYGAASRTRSGLAAWMTKPAPSFCRQAPVPRRLPVRFDRSHWANNSWSASQSLTDWLAEALHECSTWSALLRPCSVPALYGNLLGIGVRLVNHQGWTPACRCQASPAFQAFGLGVGASVQTCLHNLQRTGGLTRQHLPAGGAARPGAVADRGRAVRRGAADGGDATARPGSACCPCRRLRPHRGKLLMQSSFDHHQAMQQP